MISSCWGNARHYPVLLICVMLAGCVRPGTVKTGEESQTAARPAAETVALNHDLSQCQSELVSLRAFDSGVYDAQKAALDNSINRASQYSLMRPRLSTDMHQVMDSVYQAQLARRCQEIHARLFQLMLKHADGQQ